jgi:hypothetical protein
VYKTARQDGVKGTLDVKSEERGCEAFVKGFFDVVGQAGSQIDYRARREGPKLLAS